MVMELTLISGTANLPLAEAIAVPLGLPLGRRVVQRFPDDELHIEIEDSVRGHDVYLLQSTSPPADTHLFELLLLADACRRAGAARLTAVIPYFGYARQDRRASGREPVAARLVADLLQTAGLHRIVAVDLHSSAVEGFFPMPIEHVSAIPLLAAAIQPDIPPNAVIVAPDLGAVKLAERYAKLLQLPLAFVRKSRLSGDTVRVDKIVGDVQGRVPVMVDDMISTGGTIAAAFQALQEAGAASAPLIVVASHGLFAGLIIARMRGLPLQRIVVTDSVVSSLSLEFPLQRQSLKTLLADVIRRLHQHESLEDLLLHR